jgi:hypothetical protein
MQISRDDAKKRAAALAGIASTNKTGGTLGGTTATTQQKTLLGQ